MVRRALVIERDADLRQTLELVLEDAGYAVAGVEDVSLAEAGLRVSPHPLVVLVSHGDPARRGRSLAEAAGSLPPHAYVLLSTRPQTAPHLLNPHTEHVVPVVAEPFDVDVLLAAVDDASERLFAEPAWDELRDAYPDDEAVHEREAVMAAVL